MNTHMPRRLSRWMRRVVGTVAVFALLLNSTGNAYAFSFLFQDDDFHDMPSEGLIINSDDGGDEDVTLQFGSDTTDATIIFDDGTGDITFATTGGDFSFSDDNLTTTGALLFSGSSEFHIREVAGDPNTVAACTTLDELVLNTVNNQIYVCTLVGAALTATWSSTAGAGSQDFEGVYTTDSGNNLVTTDGIFTITTGTNDFVVDSNDWNVTAAGVLDAASLTANTGDITATSGDLVIGSVGLNDTGAGVSGAGLVGFDNANSANLSSTTVQAAIDEIITDLGSTSNGDGAALVSIEDASTWYTGTDAEAAFNEVEALLGSTTSTTYGFAEDNVLADNDSVYPALNKLDLKWGDLGNTASGEGASLVGIFDTAGNFTSTDVEGALAELAGDDVADGTVTNNTLRWSGSAWVESANFTSTSTGNIDAAGTITAGSGNNTITTAAGLLDAAVSVIGDANTKYTSTTIDGALDEISTTTGGAIIGIADTSAWYTGTDVETALDELEALLGSTTSTTYGFTEDNVLADNDSVYPALNKLDLKWGDLASVANGEGASLVGVEDSGGNFTATDVEGVLTEIAGQIGANAPNVDEMTFYPEYPDAVVFKDGSSNKGKLVTDYDSTNRRQFYRWTTKKSTSNDIDVRFRYELPADFVDATNIIVQLRTDTTTVGDNSVAVTVRNDTDNTTCHADGTVVGSVANTWETLTITGVEIDTGCSAGALLAAGDIVEIQLKLAADNTSSGGIDVGSIAFDYTN